MKESTKKKLDSIDKSKIKVQESKDLLAKIEKALNNDKNEENQAKAEKLLDVFIAKAKAKNADIFKTEEPAKPKTPAQKKQVAQATKSKLDSLMDTIANDPLFKDFNSARRSKGGGKSDPLIDSERKARESGRRVSQKGWSNQYGKSKGGRRYYEYRENRIDRKAPTYGSKPWLEDGGLIHPSDKFQEKYSVIEIKGDGSRRVHNTFPDFETAMVFASLKRNVMPSNTRIVVEDEKGTTMYRSFKSGGEVDESTAMVLSQNKAIAHHTKELKNAISKNEKVEPWVIGKMQRASTDMSDVTHYFDGMTEYAKGGSVRESGYYAYPSGDEGNELGVFKNKKSMISFALANKDKYGKLIFEGIDNDDILEVNKRDSQDVVTWVFSRIGMDRKEANKKIKMWFISNYPADEEEAKQIDESVTFDDIWFDLKNQRGIYDRLGNSYVVREVFEKIASIYGVEYDFVEKMYKRESYAKGGYMADGGQLTEEDYNNAFESKGYLDAEDFAKIDSTIEAKYLDRDRKSGVHEKFTKWWYNGGSKIAMAKYGNNEIEAWENAYEDFKDDYYKMAKGGKIVDQYDGRTPEDIWNNLTKSQRQHFLYDHRDIIEAYRGDEELKNKEIIEAYNSDWKGLDKDIKNRFANHTREGEYAKGGYMEHRGTITDDSLESILKSDFPNLNYQTSYNEINGYEIYGQKDVVMIIQKHLLDEYGIISEYVKETFGLPYLRVYSQFVDKETFEETNGDKMAKGGLVEEIKMFDKYNYPSQKTKGDKVRAIFEHFKKKGYSTEEINTALGKMNYAKGGYMADGGKVKWQDVFVGDKALVIEENKMGYVIKPYGRRFHLKFPDGSEKTYSAEELEFFKDEEYAKGGKTPTGDYTNRRNLHLIVIKNPNKSGTKEILTIDKKDFLDGLHKMEDGGSLSKGYTYIKRADVNQVAYYDKNGKLQVEFKPKNGFWVSKKALVDAGMNETKAKFDKKEVANQLTASSNEAWDKLSIQSGSEIYASDTLQQDLADEYQRLGINKIYKQLTKAERKKVSDVLTDENEHSLRNYLALRGYNGEAEYKNYVKMFEEGKAKFGYTSNWNPKNVDLPIVPFAEGGKIGFEGLSNKVAKNYEGKKVAPKYQDEYGKTYDKKEAKEVGKKVASKVYRQQLAKMEHGGELPEDLGKYFIKTRSTKVIPMSNIIPLRARAEGIANAEKYMKMAYDGKMDKRKPITLYKSQGKYRVYDGNSTYAVAKANGWENIWAEVIKNPNMNTKEKRGVDIFTKAKQIRKEGEAWKDALQRAKAMK